MKSSTEYRTEENLVLFVTNTSQKVKVSKFPLHIGRLKTTPSPSYHKNDKFSGIIEYFEDSNSISINNSFMSRKHAIIVKMYSKNASFLKIIDLGSSNGTFVNGRRVLGTEGVILKDGDLVRFGEDDLSDGKENGEAIRCKLIILNNTSSGQIPSLSNERILKVYEIIIIILVVIIYQYAK